MTILQTRAWKLLWVSTEQRSVGVGARAEARALSFSYQGGKVGGLFEPRRARTVWKHRETLSKKKKNKYEQRNEKASLVSTSLVSAFRRLRQRGSGSEASLPRRCLKKKTKQARLSSAGL